MEEQINAEDEYLAELIKRDNEIVYFKTRLDSTTKLLEQEKENSKQKDMALNEKDKLILELAKTLKENNVPVEIIIEKTNPTRE